MNIPTVLDWRNKRNLNHLSVQSMNYSTYSLPDITENKNMKGEIYDMYHPDIKTFSEMVTDKKFDGKNEKSEPWLIRSALHMCTMIFRKISGRASSPELSYHDCEPPGQEAPTGFWQSARTENKNVEARTALSDWRSDMNGGYDSVVASCEDKLNKVRQLISSKSAPSSPKSPAYKSRRRRRVFVESNLVEDCFEDAFSPEDFINESNSDGLTFIIPYQYQKCEVFEIETPKMKIENQMTDLNSQNVPEDKKDLNLKVDAVKTDIVDFVEPEAPKKTNIETVSSCESKIMQLQAMLKERRKRNTKTLLNSPDSAPEPVKDLLTDHTKPKIIPSPKIQDKRYKNRHRLSTGKRKKAETRKLINDDMLFADEIAEDPSSFNSSPIIPVALDKSVESLGSSADDCFDEVAGRFRTASGTDSDDSFQVVFADSPRAMRPSDCESEDSFIVFEDSPDSCYTSNDVFGDESDSESEYSDSDSEVSDSGCGDSEELKMSQNMTKTFGDLTDNSLYEDKDEVDNAVNICAEIPSEHLHPESAARDTGVLLNDAKKLLRRNQPPKKVQFSPQPPAVLVMRVWTFAARQARAGHWERLALDRDRFRRRIADADMALSWVLKPQHRSRVMFQRFMPWWNAQKRKEIADKKEEKRRMEEEQRKIEDQKKIEEQPTECQVKEKENNDSKEEETNNEKVVERNKIDEDLPNIGDENREIDGVTANTKIPNEESNVEKHPVNEKGNIVSDEMEKPINNSVLYKSVSEINEARTGAHFGV
ncbi:uncharacterized protein PPP1R15 [Plodia interpunctella]|uniref:uncharacterized protein PPP1R15 n=1 Tax=Plodia interpunctella TaxID=58824 RepID=UPI002367CD31|nr:uncharacterized protein LOC128681711 [Plodia interpunctella]